MTSSDPVADAAKTWLRYKAAKLRADRLMEEFRALANALTNDETGQLAKMLAEAVVRGDADQV